MAKPIIELTKKEFEAKSFSRPVIKETCSYDGDWNRLDFDAKEYHVETFLPHDLEWLSIARKSPKVFVDGLKGNWNYLHVPYDWSEDMRVFRVYPIWDLNQKYRTTLHKTIIIKSVLAYQLDGNSRWFWKVNFE